MSSVSTCSGWAQSGDQCKRAHFECYGRLAGPCVGVPYSPGVNIAERSEFLAHHDPVNAPFDFELMAEKTQAMVRKSIDALVNIDCSLAHQVCEMDDEVDAINKQMYDLVKQSILKHPENIEGLIHLLSVSRHLERIGDHATNIAEDVIYMAEGRIIRHKTEEYL